MVDVERKIGSYSGAGQENRAKNIHRRRWLCLRKVGGGRHIVDNVQASEEAELAGYEAKKNSNNGAGQRAKTQQN